MLVHLSRRLFLLQILPTSALWLPSRCMQVSLIYLTGTPLHPHLTPSPAAFFFLSPLSQPDKTHLFGLSPTRVISKGTRTFWSGSLSCSSGIYNPRTQRWLFRTYLGGDGVKGCPLRTPLPSGVNVKPPAPLLASSLEWIPPTPLQLAAVLTLVVLWLIICPRHNSQRDRRSLIRLCVSLPSWSQLSGLTKDSILPPWAFALAALSTGPRSPTFLSSSTWLKRHLLRLP